MYEQNISVRRRVVVLVAAFIVIVVVLWFLVWLIFFRGRHSSTDRPAHHGSSQSQSSESSTSDSSVANTPTNTGNINSPATTTHPQLANTGPGDVMTPVITTMIAGVVAYQIRLHRKLNKQSQ